jgi:hypothetical protein
MPVSERLARVSLAGTEIAILLSAQAMAFNAIWRWERPGLVAPGARQPAAAAMTAASAP